ncbi:MAG: hypothetical protein P8H39_07545 [Thalassotalea sp.]|nr:hypothetical protein [Thalassotalea sp.]
MTYYLTAFVLNGTGPNCEKLKIVEKYTSAERAKIKLNNILVDKKQLGWKVTELSEEERNETKNNLISIASGETPDGINMIMWAISIDPTPSMDGQAMFPEAVDITREVQSKARMDKMALMSNGEGFLFALKETFKQNPKISIAITVSLIWLAFF